MHEFLVILKWGEWGAMLSDLPDYRDGEISSKFKRPASETDPTPSATVPECVARPVFLVFPGRGFSPERSRVPVDGDVQRGV